jgi:hypothetical protein
MEETLRPTFGENVESHGNIIACRSLLEVFEFPKLLKLFRKRFDV